jgi:hypothetical protein
MSARGVIVDLDPPGVRDPVLISLGFVLASACVRLRFGPPAERRRDMWRRESELYPRQEGTVQWRHSAEGLVQRR